MKNIRPFGSHKPKLGNGVFVDPMAVVTGDVTLGHDASVWPMVSIRGDLLPIKIGDRSNIQDGSVLHTSHDSKYFPGGASLTIGNDVTVGHAVVLHGCTINDKVLIGMGAIVLDRAIINSNIILGAGTLVPPNKELESGYLYVGSPAKKARPLTESELEFLSYSAASYVKNKDLHLAEK
ncbi:gamma carbonic anhydrase family protein [Francisellaceae bacterium]|nr:gamma carbonic anhydrase family protein [Francisellaceae bacterium]